MKHLLFTAISDIHFHNWKKHNKQNWRTDLGFKVIKDIFMEHGHKAPILIPGDWLQNPNNISRGLLAKLINTFDSIFAEIPSAKCYTISGNHDCDTHMTPGGDYDSWATILSSLYPGAIDCIDFKRIFHAPKGITISGIPYCTDDVFHEALDKHIRKINPNKTNVLMVHQALPGARDTNGYGDFPDQLKNSDSVYSKLAQFDIVISGHIHKSQPLSDEVVMVGAPYQQRASDAGGQFGYWQFFIDIEDSIRFSRTFTAVDSVEFIETPPELIDSIIPPQIPVPIYTEPISNSAIDSFGGSLRVPDLMDEYIAEVTPSKKRKKILKSLIEKSFLDDTLQ